MYVEKKIYIPNNLKLKERILQKNYDRTDIGHLGQQRIMELVKKNYWWPGLKEDIKNMFKDILNVNKTKFNIKENMKNYTY